MRSIEAAQCGGGHTKVRATPYIRNRAWIARRSRVSLISRDNGEMLIYCTSKRAERLARTPVHERKYALRPGMAPVPPMETSINSPCGENLAE